MQNIIVTRYDDPKAIGWAGYIEPADKAWIAFIDLKGKPRFYLYRCPVTGAVNDDPAWRAGDPESEGAAVEESASE